jgi:hypothetical protein
MTASVRTDHAILCDSADGLTPVPALPERRECVRMAAGDRCRSVTSWPAVGLMVVAFLPRSLPRDEHARHSSGAFRPLVMADGSDRLDGDL